MEFRISTIGNKSRKLPPIRCHAAVENAARAVFREVVDIAVDVATNAVVEQLCKLCRAIVRAVVETAV